jgi:DnaJ C terminal domain
MAGVREYFCGSYIVQHGKPHKVFTRRGNDLLWAFPISFAQAARGAEIEVLIVVRPRRRCRERRSVRCRATYCGQAAPVAAQRRTSA